MNRLLDIAELVCGAAARRNVFEPLLADWQRQLSETKTLTDHARVVVSGSIAMAIAIVSCLLEGGVVMPRQALAKGVVIIIVSTVTLLAIEIGIMTASINNNIPLEMRFWLTLPVALRLVIPLAMLTFMMVIRGLGPVKPRSAAVVTCAGAAAAYLTAAVLTPMLQRDVRDELYEQAYLQTVADDRAGIITYPGTARRQALPTTPEQRAAAREKWRRSPWYVKYEVERTRAQWGRESIMMAALTLAMGGLGWALGGLGRTSITGAAGWWLFAFMVMMFDGRVLFPGSRIAAIIGRPPSWLPLAVFTAAAVVLLVTGVKEKDKQEEMRH